MHQSGFGSHVFWTIGYAIHGHSFARVNRLKASIASWIIILLGHCSLLDSLSSTKYIEHSQIPNVFIKSRYNGQLKTGKIPFTSSNTPATIKTAILGKFALK